MRHAMAAFICHCIFIIMIAIHEMSAICSPGSFDSRSSFQYPICPDQQTGMSYRSGYPEPRWPSQAYGYSAVQSHSPPYGYSQNHGGYGNGYSYGYSDVRRSGPSPYSYSSSYMSYPRTSYPQAAYKYGQADPYHQTLNMQYYPSSSQYYPNIPSSYPNRVPQWYSSSQNYYPGVYQHSGSGQFRSEMFPDPNIVQQQNYLFPFGRQNFMREAYAILKGHPSSAVDGKIEFCQVGASSIRIKGRVTGVPGGPGNRGLHILKDAACPPLAQFPIDPKALEHFNPLNSAVHGSRDAAQKHSGDLGNIFVQIDGVTTMDFTVDQLTMDHPVYSIANHSIVITDHEDDLGMNQQNVESRFRGNSGRAIACGVIHVKDSPLPPPGPMMPGNPHWEDPFARRPEYYPSYPPPVHQYFH